MSIFNHSYGRVEELVYFAGLKEQYETLVHHYVQVLYKSSSSINISSTLNCPISVGHSNCLVRVEVLWAQGPGSSCKSFWRLLTNTLSISSLAKIVTQSFLEKSIEVVHTIKTREIL